MKILIADDSMMVRRILERFAGQLKLDLVGSAANGREPIHQRNYRLYRSDGKA